MRATKTAGGKIVVYHYDKDGRVISETDSAGNLISDYIYLNGKLVAKKAPSAVYFYHTDPAGTPMAMTNMSRDVMWSADYKPFGEESWISGTLENNEKFVGKEKDKETGLYYFGARYMETKIGRFAIVDPARISEVDLINPQRLNRYSYGLNNPYKYMDTTGKWAEDVHSGIGNFKYGTYTWARQVGFNDKDAKIIARGNNATDQNAGWAIVAGVPGRHFNTSISGEIDTRNIFSKQDFQLALTYYKRGNLEKALSILGRGLHSVQDRTAHGDLLFFWPHPEWIDDVKERPDELRQTESLSKDYLNQFMKSIKEKADE